MNLILLEEGEAASREAALDGRRAQHIREVRLRTEEFPKNTSRKILRHKAGQERQHV